MSENYPLVCDLTILPASAREKIAATVPKMFQAVQKVQELNDGYAFQFPNDPGMFMTLAQFIEHERQCCSFYRIILEIEPHGGPLWLRLTGNEDVKQFLQTVWGDLQSAVDKQLMQTGPDHQLDEAIAQAAPVLADTLDKAVPHTEDET